MQLNLRIQMNESLYLRDPESTELGQRIILNSIELINELGFEGFTFKKLGEYMGTTEASIYRYFENKHRLLTYLVSWYWSWLEYRIIILTQNMNDSREQLNRVVELLSRKIKDDISTTYINEELLQNIVIAEGSKSYLTKHVGQDNQFQFYKPFKELCARIADIIQACNKQYPYPKSLATTLLEMCHSHHYYKLHLPSLTEFAKDKNDQELYSFMQILVNGSLNGANL